jgi:predicted nucleic acid-binding protein
MMASSPIRPRMSANFGMSVLVLLIARLRPLPSRDRPTRKDLRGKAPLTPDSLAVHEEWRKLLVTHGVSGVQVHNARLVAAMHVHGVKRILTFNDKDFARYPDVEAVHPRSVSLA